MCTIIFWRGEGVGADGRGYWAVICQNPFPRMYSIEQKHAFQHYIILTKMTPFNIQFGIKMALEYTLKHTLEFTGLHKLCINDDTVKCSRLVGFC